jgi:hypothetical protein
MLGPFIGFCVLAGGQCEPVFRDRIGRQYILDSAGGEVYGEWLPSAPAQEPHFLKGPKARPAGGHWRSNVLA